MHLGPRVNLTCLFTCFCFVIFVSATDQQALFALREVRTGDSVTRVFLLRSGTDIGAPSHP